MQKDISVDQLSKWKSNFTENKDLQFITCSALIKIEDFRSFVNMAESQKADGIRINFIRFNTNETVIVQPPWDSKTWQFPEGCKFKEAGNELTQGSIAMVPIKNFQIDENFVFNGDDIVNDNKITVLIPGIDLKGTGHCPPGSCEHEELSENSTGI